MNYHNYFLMDNFRGFKESVVPLTNTNFVVGENSSGKSSLLSLVKILTDIDFWFRQDFKSESVSLGHFSDIVSVNAEDKSYFRVGYLPQKFTENKESFFSIGFLATFGDKNGIPKLKTLSIQFEGHSLHIKLGAASINYRVDKNDVFEINDVETAKKTLTSMIEIHNGGKSFTTIKLPILHQNISLHHFLLTFSSIVNIPPSPSIQTISP